LVLATVVAVAALDATAASAGGFGRGSADIDILFEDGTFVTRDSATFVDPNRAYDSKPARAGVSQALDGREFSDSYWVPSIAAKAGLTDDLSCAATYTVSNGASSDNRGLTDNRGKIKEGFTTDEYGLTCAYRFDLPKGRLSVIGGAFYEEFSYDLSAIALVAPGVRSALRVNLQDADFGWRGGLAYEIPEIALRASLMYRSGTSAAATGEADFSTVGVVAPAFGWGELPQSVELKVQSGIAEDWGAFGSVKWTDWSVMDRLHLRFGVQDTYNEYHWRDGITVSGGIGHNFSDNISGFTSVTWDRGVSTGWDLYGDTVSFAVGSTVKTKVGDFRFTAAAIWLASEQETEYGSLSASSRNSWGYGLQAQYKITF
jgi:long-chain fatty acid transport protein